VAKAAKVLEFAKAAFDAVAHPVQGFLAAALLFAVRAWRSDSLGFHRLFHMREDLVRVIAVA